MRPTALWRTPRPAALRNFTTGETRKKFSLRTAPSDSICYTLREDDVTKGEKPRFTPYLDREAVFPDGGALLGNRLEFRSDPLNAVLRYEFFVDALRVEIFSENPALCEFGLNLPFCF